MYCILLCLHPYPRRNKSCSCACGATPGDGDDDDEDDESDFVLLGRYHAYGGAGVGGKKGGQGGTARVTQEEEYMTRVRG